MSSDCLFFLLPHDIFGVLLKKLEKKDIQQFFLTSKAISLHFSKQFGLHITLNIKPRWFPFDSMFNGCIKNYGSRHFESDYILRIKKQKIEDPEFFSLDDFLRSGKKNEELNLKSLTVYTGYKSVSYPNTIEKMKIKNGVPGVGELPKGLKELYIDTMPIICYYTITRCENLEKLIIDSFYDILEIVSTGDTLFKIDLSCFSRLKYFSFNTNQRIEFKFPESLETLIVRGFFNYPLDLPNRLKVLKLNQIFRKKLLLPNSIETFISKKSPKAIYTDNVTVYPSSIKIFHQCDGIDHNEMCIGNFDDI